MLDAGPTLREEIGCEVPPVPPGTPPVEGSCLLVGAELLYGQARRIDGAEASDTRLHLTARYVIF